MDRELADMMFEEAPAGGGEHFGDAIWKNLLRFGELLESEGELRGLIGPRERDKLWSRHILNSTAIVDFLPQNASLVDVGSGAGFPGLVAAIIRPDLTVNLVDSLGRRTDWLSYVVDDLQLSNVTVHNKRAEEMVGVISADVATARAVAALKNFCHGQCLWFAQAVSWSPSKAVGQKKKLRRLIKNCESLKPIG